ncbi:hypothetical protein PENTCL1PPCAC_16061, partial [Pristionchus entomophagus]
HHFPYWGNVHHLNSLRYGSPIGEVVNTPEKYAFTVDVSHFKPEEIRANLAGNELTVEGSHDEKTDQHGTIQRSFIRKYTLPDDANLKSIRTYLTPNGHLTIEASKKTNDLVQSSAIPITMISS